jgi:hypothetical protein
VAAYERLTNIHLTLDEASGAMSAVLLQVTFQALPLRFSSQ